MGSPWDCYRTGFTIALPNQSVDRYSLHLIVPLIQSVDRNHSLDGQGVGRGKWGGKEIV